MRRHTSHLAGAPTLDADLARRVIGGRLSPADELATTREIYAVALTIRRRRPPGWRDPQRWGPNYVTDELRDEIRERARAAQSVRLIARDLEVRKDVVAAAIEEPETWGRCRKCGRTIKSPPGELTRASRELLAALLAARVPLATDRWADSVGRQAHGRRWEETLVPLVEAGLARWTARGWIPTDLARGECVACYVADKQQTAAALKRAA